MTENDARGYLDGQKLGRRVSGYVGGCGTTLLLFFAAWCALIVYGLSVNEVLLLVVVAAVLNWIQMELRAAARRKEADWIQMAATCCSGCGTELKPLCEACYRNSLHELGEEDAE